MKILPPVSIEARRLLPSRWDVLAALLVLGFIALFADASRSLVEPLASLTRQPLSLDPANLPGYALRTALRMLIALGVSLVFTFTYATWAAKSARAGRCWYPYGHPAVGADPWLYLHYCRLFLSLAPEGSSAELAAVFAIHEPSLNMAFGFTSRCAPCPRN
jgi:NitT/TauT family transport system permease protein